MFDPFMECTAADIIGMTPIARYQSTLRKHSDEISGKYIQDVVDISPLKGFVNK